MTTKKPNEPAGSKFGITKNSVVTVKVITLFFVIQLQMLF